MLHIQHCIKHPSFKTNQYLPISPYMCLCIRVLGQRTVVWQNVFFNWIQSLKIKYINLFVNQIRKKVLLIYDQYNYAYIYGSHYGGYFEDPPGTWRFRFHNLTSHYMDQHYENLFSQYSTTYDQHKYSQI